MTKKINKILAHNGDYKVLLDDQTSQIPIINSNKQVYMHRKRWLNLISSVPFYFLIVMLIIVIIAIKCW